jgi:single-stranded-DNA-specific exonuclease
VYWDAAIRVLNKEFGKGDSVDAVFNVSRDWYKGVPTPQMTIIDMRKSG